MNTVTIIVNEQPDEVNINVREMGVVIADGLWEHDVEGVSIKPILSKTVDASHLSGTIDGGPLHP